MKEIFENIKNDKEFKYLYFDSEQKKFVENILNNQVLKFYLVYILRHLEY